MTASPTQRSLAHLRSLGYVPERFAEKCMPEPNSGCWLWLGHCTKDGYGVFKVSTQITSNAHRVSYVLHKGDIPPGHEIDHCCRVRCCVNPAHLEAVTHRENMVRAAPHQPQITHCVNGHALSDDNIYTQPDGYRKCRACRVDNRRRWRERQRVTGA